MRTKHLFITVLLVAIVVFESCTTKNRQAIVASDCNNYDSIGGDTNNSLTISSNKLLEESKNIDVEMYDSLIVYYPNFTHIDLVTASMPDKEVDSNVIFCCEAAYTGACLNEFRHSNIAGDHVSSGVRYQGYRCTRNTGAFVWYDGQWKFLRTHYSNELDTAAIHGGMGFGQEIMIHEGEICQTVRPDNNGPNLYRALCEADGKLCIIDCRLPMYFGCFKKLLIGYGVNSALYLDMGSGWNHSWYRDNNGNSVEIHPKTHGFCTNWLTFYR